MTASLRSPRLLQRLSAASQPAASLRSSTRGACIQCQLRSPLYVRSARRHPAQQTRPFTLSTPIFQEYNVQDTSAAKLSAPDVSNYYTIFPNTLPKGPPPGSPFDLPVPTLRREFLQLQNMVHPDKYPQGVEKQQAEALSARINEAYRTLADPLLRAQYLLREMHGIDVTAEDGASKHELDPKMMMEVMEVQETIEEVGNEPGAQKTIDAMKEDNQARVAECLKMLGDAFDKGDVETARKETVRLRFWYSVGEGLHEWEPGMTEIRLVH